MPLDPNEVPDPPQPPEGGRILRFHATQAIGVPLLAIIPILALLSVFGASHTAETANASSLAVEVLYPTRFRYKTIHELHVTVRNQGDVPLQDVSVWIDKSYLNAFSTVSFTPSPQRVTSDAYLFELGEIVPGDARTLDGIVQAEDYWWHTGRVTVDAEGEPQATLDVGTFTFP